MASLEGLISIESVSDTLSEEERLKLRELYPDGKVRMWGVKPNLRRMWEVLNEDDYVLFYSKNLYVCVGEAAFKTVNRQLAERVWGKDEAGETWEFIFFLKNILEINVHREEFNGRVGYNKDFVPEGFIRVREGVREKIIEEIISKTVQKSVFSFTEKDFKACTGKKEDAKYLAERFKTLLSVLNGKLSDELKDFTKGYVARPLNQGSKKYRDHMWLGLVHDRLEGRPHDNVQFQVSISPRDQISIDVYIDSRAVEARKRAKSNVEKNRSFFLEQVNRLKGSKIGFFNGDRVEFQADKMNDDDLSRFLKNMDRGRTHVYVSKIMTKEEALSKGGLIVDEIITTWEQMLPVYQIMAFGEVVQAPIGFREISTLIESEPEYSDTIKVAFAHLVAGRNLVFYGPPGTSKTYLAKKICEKVCGEDNFSLHTANAEWSYFDIVGGPVLQSGKTTFKPGILLEAVQKCEESIARSGKPHWLIIDELNRANLDLAFGKIFTQLDIDYRDIFPIEKVEEEGGPHKYFMPFSFRILATMNTYDRALLFSLGYAFMRRFAFIPVESLLRERRPSESGVEFPVTEDMIKFSEREDFRRLKEKAKDVVYRHFSKKKGEDRSFLYKEVEMKSADDVNEILSKLKIGPLDAIDALLYVASRITNGGLVEIGHVIVFDAAKFIVAYYKLFPEESEPRKLIDEAIISYILPQLEYFMPRLRKGKIFEDEKYKKSWENLTQMMKNLNLPKTLQKLQEAEEEFQVIH
ncbi:MAG: AAA family ATPase [Candidatus Bathyarchaeia archaeon]